MMNWDDLKIFLAVAEAPSMRAAAKTLRISHSTVSRRIDSLESNLSARLFDRLPEGYKLTTAGRDLVPVAQQLRQEVDAYHLKTLGRDKGMEGNITLTMPDAIAISCLMPIIAAFQQKHPAITIKIDDSASIYDLNRREADIALRVTNAPSPHLVGRKLGTVYQAVYASRTYLEKTNPNDPASDAKWIGWGTPEDNPAWIARSPYPHLALSGHYDNALIQREAVRNDMGLGYLPCILMDDDDSFVQLSEPVPSMEFWVLTHRDLKETARLKAFRDFIFEHAPTLSKRFRGKQKGAEAP
ncbi:LysR family transcriptional regulator [Kordiimonas aquimaris]|uniref:LysR family transcriptional regulator n=1 Tax=Kordiimonas aquimaris TaxID=707591 RepID=UPI0021D36DF7|nr:LysR family transcriptional regulator [Kordiimonas aquimaris]